MERAHRAVEDVAWRASSSSRRFFVVLALTVFVLIFGASVIAARVAARNADAVSDGRARGLEVAGTVTEFRDHLGSADAEQATALLTGEHPSSLGRVRYEAELRAAGQSLTNAGLEASGRNAVDIRALAEGLVRYAQLVETSRAYDVGSRFHDDAMVQVRDRLVPDARRVRGHAEGEVVATADRVTGPLTTLAVVGLAVAMLVLVAASVVVAGRTRIRFQAALVASALVMAVELVVVLPGLWSPRRELQMAANEEIGDFVDANETAFAVFDLRSTEMRAVAPLDEDDMQPGDLGDDDLYDRFENDVEWLARHLPSRSSGLRAAVDDYAEAVADEDDAESDPDVEDLDRAGQSAQAMAASLDGPAATTYRRVRGLAVSTVNRATADLTRRLQRAEGTQVEWGVPLAFGAVAGGLAGGGILHRGRHYLGRRR